MKTTRRIALAVSCALAAGLVAGPAAAGTGPFGRDRVHADSFGNLVIMSPAGYKRILVGKGYAADAYHATGSYYEPEHDVPPPRREGARADCEYAPLAAKGRSYMYGQPEDFVFSPSLVCR